MSLTQLQQQFQDSSLFSNTSKQITTNLEVFDALPLYQGSITEIYGSPSSGKTITLYQLIANIQKEYHCVYINCSGSFDKRLAKFMNIDLSDLIYGLPGDDSLSILQQLAECSNIVILIDSLPNLVATDQDLEKFMEFKEILIKNNNTLIITNQMRAGYKSNKTPLNKLMQKICNNRIQLISCKIKSNKSGKWAYLEYKLTHEYYFSLDKELKYKIKVGNND